MRTAILFLVLALATSAGATVYVNRDYYWYEPGQQWRYNIVDRYYSGNVTWGIDTDFGLQGRGSPYILEADVYVNAGATLRVEPGVVVRTPPGRGIYVAGTLDAQGTPAGHISFTSTGGTSPGSWDEICIYGDSAGGTVLRYCDISYAGGGSYHAKGIGWHDAVGALLVSGCAPTVENCVITQSAYDAVYLRAGARPTFTNVTFQSCNRWAIFCEDIGSNPVMTGCSASGNGRNGARIPGGTIADARVWYSFFPYVIQGEVYIRDNASLTLKPGTIVKFDSDSSLYVNGNLQAVGTETASIYFTSFLDDTVGGDTNGDGNATTPGPGNWREICIYGASSTSSRLERCIVRYGGNGVFVPSGIGWHSAYGNILVCDSAPSIANCSVSHSGNHAFYGRGGCQAVIRDSSFSDSGYGMVLADNSYYQPFTDPLPIRRNTISANNYAVYCSAQAAGAFAADNNITGNVHSVCQIYGSTIQNSLTWRRMVGVYSWQLLGDVYCWAPNSLTIEPGCVVKFNTGVALYTNSVLRAVGSELEKIYFTSYRDDSVGGDSNPGDPSPPERGDWGEILIAGSESSSSRLEHCVLRYGGSGRWDAPVIGWHNMYANIFIHQSNPTIVNTISSDSGYDAVYLRAGARPTFTNVTFQSCNRWAIFCEDIGSNPIITDCSAVDCWRTAIGIPGGTISDSRSWYKSIPYVVREEVYIAGKLSLEPGAVVKLDPHVGLYVSGNLQAVGTPENFIYFTSILDDTAGGDTNGDGDATSPSPGSWREICIYGSSSSPTRLVYCAIRYGGNAAWLASGIGWHNAFGNVLCADTGASFDYCEISYAGYDGLWCRGSDQTLQNCTLAKNSRDGLRLEGDSDAVLNSCILSQNGSAAIRQFTSQGASLSAAYCDVDGVYTYEVWSQSGWYWGTGLPSGPGNFSANPMFVDPDVAAFQLQAGSPCIDAGDPAMTDPDGSRLDVGAYTFGGPTVVPISIRSARNVTDGTLIRIAGNVATAGTVELCDRAYIEQTDRTCGIAVATSSGCRIGDKLDVRGKMATIQGERVIVDTVVVILSVGKEPPKPLFMAVKNVGGSDQNSVTPGIPGRPGTNNIGLLITVVGRVTGVGAGCFWLDDGSNIPAQGGRVGIKVLSRSAVNVGDMVKVVGISGAYLDGTTIRSVIRTRIPRDVSVVQ